MVEESHEESYLFERAGLEAASVLRADGSWLRSVVRMIPYSSNLGAWHIATPLTICAVVLGRGIGADFVTFGLGFESLS